MFVCMLCRYMLDVLFFFFKQKTAYEMRISDWSSDVCSSDLSALLGPGQSRHAPGIDPVPDVRRPRHPALQRAGGGQRSGASALEGALLPPIQKHGVCRSAGSWGRAPLDANVPRHRPSARSEEHTSELQSLMRISYAVFRLKKKK